LSLRGSDSDEAIPIKDVIMEFKYKAIDKNGRTVKGIIESENETYAVEVLKKKNLSLLSIKPVRYIFKKSLRIKPSELILFTRIFAQLIKSRISVVNALNIIKSTLKNRKFISIIENIQKDLSAGKSLSFSFRKYPSVFSNFYCAVLESGENSGKLDEVLQLLYNYIYKSNELKKNILSAIIYPVIVTITALIILTGIILFLVPQFHILFEQFDCQLPLLTRIVLGLNLFLKNYILLILFILTGFFLLILTYFNTSKGKILKDKILLKLPIVSLFVKETIYAKFTRMLGVLIFNEVDILKSLSITSNLINNSIIRNNINIVADSIKKGSKVSEAFTNARIFPDVIIQMTNIGEETGDFADMFLVTAQFYEESLEMKSKILLAVIQPALIIITGIIIMFILISIFLPIFQLSNIIK